MSYSTSDIFVTDTSLKLYDRVVWVGQERTVYTIESFYKDNRNEKRVMLSYLNSLGEKTTYPYLTENLKAFIADGTVKIVAPEITSNIKGKYQL